MKKEKRLLSSLLALSMSVSMYSPALAEELFLEEQTKNVEDTQLEQNNETGTKKELKSSFDKEINNETNKEEQDVISEENNKPENISNGESNGAVDTNDKQEIISKEESNKSENISSEESNGAVDTNGKQEIISKEEESNKSENISNEENNGETDTNDKQEIISKEEENNKLENISNEENNDEADTNDKQEIISKEENNEADVNEETKKEIISEEQNNLEEQEDDSEEKTSGTCGENLTWKLENDVLTISGTGDMYDYVDNPSYGSIPWGEKAIKTVIIEEGVTSIGDSAFASCTTLQDVEIASSVKSIGDSAFNYCYFLTNINLPENVVLGKNVFERCTLSRITIPDGVTDIKEYTFGECIGLKEIIIPKSITNIESSAFLGCSALKDIYYKGSKEDWEAIIGIDNEDFKNATIHYNSTDSFDKIEVATSGTCGDDITWELKDGTLTLSGTGAMDEYFISSIVSLPPWYQSLNAIEKVIMSEGITNISAYAFADCKNLQEVTIPSTVTDIGYQSFFSCQSLEEIVLPHNVGEIGSYAFAYCDNLISITIPDTIAEIWSRAFVSCSNLTDVYYEGSEEDWKAISIEASGNEALTTATIHYNSNSENPSPNNCGKDLTWTLENGILTINGTGNMYNYNLAPWYRNRESITKVVLPDGITSIGNYAFSECTNLSSINLPDGITRIGERAFDFCENLTEINIPDSVTYIGENAFRECKLLVRANIPSSIINISDRIFYNCESLTEINIPEGVASISDSAFYNCKSLTEIVLPESVTSIGQYAFGGCGSLTKINIPKNITKIEINTFSRCESLTKIEIPESVTKIESSAFSHCKGLTEINMPNSVTSIGSYAFSSCSSLKNITISNKVTNLGESMFSDCSNLTEITLPVSIIGIGSTAFYKCDSLTDVYYEGNEEDWKAISISSRGNDPLKTATIHYNSKIPEKPDKPSKPEQPDTPDVPSKPDKPGIPNIPDKPSTPDVPTTPDKPENPVTPEQQFTITFSGNGGKIDGETMSSFKTDKTGKLTSLPTSIRTGYTFDGWFTEKTRGEEITTGTVFTKDTTVYAQWTKNNSSNSGSGSSGGGGSSHKHSSSSSSSKSITSNQNNLKSEDMTHFKPISEIAVTPTLSNNSNNSNKFEDVSQNVWYYEAVNYVVAHNLFSGMSANNFAPNDTMTRAMLMTVLARMDGQEVTGGTTWYEKGMNWAKQKQISDGTNPQSDITREQLAAMLYRYAGNPTTTGNLSQFSDNEQTSNYAKSALCWATEKGIISGKGNNVLDPKGKATRAEVAAMLMRFCEMQ